MSTQISKRELLSKRAVGAGLGVGTLALLAQTQRASADTPFTRFPFPATGTSMARTMPDRITEIKNVKDYGASGNGATDDTAPIQAAVNNASAPYSIANRGVIFFPTGTYVLSSPVTFELSAGITSIAFIGAPGAKIRGNFADALLKRSPNSPVGGAYLIQSLILENNNAAGKCIMFHSIVGGKIVACQLSGFTGIETYNSQSVTVDSCSIISGGNPGGIGVLAGNATSLIACDITAMGEGIRHSNAGLTVIGGRLEVNTIGINLGTDGDGNPHQSTGAFITGLSMESNSTGIQVGSLAGAGCSCLSVEALAITCSKERKANGIIIYGGDHLTFRAVAVSNSDAVTGWSGAGVNIQGGNTIIMDSVISVTTLGSTWNIVPNIDAEFTQCNAPMPTFAQLPSASGIAGNARRYIRDADANYLTYGNVAAGGGKNRAPVWTDGTNWRYG